jgi:hypothetical protein
MKRLLAVGVIAVAAVALYAATAPAGQQAVTPAQFTALKKQVAKLQKDVNTLKASGACLSATGVASFGGNTAGYHCNQPDGTEILTSALDVVDQGETPDFYLAEVDKTCVSALRLARVHAARSTH